MPSCGNGNSLLSKRQSEPGGFCSLFSAVIHWASRTFTTNQPSEAGARPEPESLSCASGTCLILPLDDHDEPARAVDALHSLELDVRGRRGPGDEHDRPARQRRLLDRRTSSGTVSTIWSARTTQTWRSGSSVNARLPCPGPPSRAIVPVTAQAAAHVVSAPSSSSRCCGESASSSTSSTPAGRSRASRSCGIPTLRASCAASGLGRCDRCVVDLHDGRAVVEEAIHERLDARRAARSPRRRRAAGPRPAAHPRRPAARARARRHVRSSDSHHSGTSAAARRAGRGCAPTRAAARAGSAGSSRRARTASGAKRASRCARS